jgi:hypothetical protein
MLHAQGSAAIMMGHSICTVYAGCHVQVLRKKTQASQRGTGEREPLRKVRGGVIPVKIVSCASCEDCCRPLTFPV